jgi:hypothetical protein
MSLILTILLVAWMTMATLRETRRLCKVTR